MDSDKIIYYHPVICKNTGYGKHITLKCRNHLSKKWNTKNILRIGCRSIFYQSRDEYECDCPMRDLFHDCEDDCKEDLVQDKAE